MDKRSHHGGGQPRNCKLCGTAFITGSNRAQFCSQEHSRLFEHDYKFCTVCGVGWLTKRKGAKICSDSCRSAYYEGRMGRKPTRCYLPDDHPVKVLIRAEAVQWQQRSALRVALESNDPDGVIAAVRAFTLDVHGCWIWQRRLNDGYPTVRVDKRTYQVHRLVLEAKHRAKLGTQAAHHMCAVTACVNPEHLQPVTARDNVAEMLSRTYMVQRIAALESALADHDPHHELLQEIGVVA